MSFSSLKDLVPKTAGKFQLQGELHAAMIINRASVLVKELFSEELQRCIRVKRFKNGELWFTVQNAAAAQEIQMKSVHIKKALNASFGKELVQKIRSFQESAAPEEDHSR